MVEKTSRLVQTSLPHRLGLQKVAVLCPCIRHQLFDNSVVRQTSPAEFLDQVSGLFGPPSLQGLQGLPVPGIEQPLLLVVKEVQTALSDDLEHQLLNGVDGPQKPRPIPLAPGPVRATSVRTEGLDRSEAICAAAYAVAH